MLADLRRHRHFLIAALIGLLAGLLAWHWPVTDRLLIGACVFYATFLGWLSLLLPRLEAQALRSRADDVDEGMPIIMLIALSAIALSLWGIVQTLRGADDGSWLRNLMALTAIPLGWAVVQCVMALHYAGMWYARDGDRDDWRGLDFGPDQPDPDIWDFMYYSFTIGMCAQTADV
ncbi:MAG: DUF1345 domain-containing protein, partial [Paracoccus sp. (in: a-proteobacteria)]|nr:DUF1345 domain-containing protein [Paracoccus sp. (in: a-proteobacteria)]